MSGATPLIPLYAFMAWTETNLPSLISYYFQRVKVKDDGIDKGKGKATVYGPGQALRVPRG